MLAHSDPETARRLLDAAQDGVRERFRLYQHLAAMPPAGPNGGTPGQHEYRAVEEPAAFERSNYMKVLSFYALRGAPSRRSH